jgi:transposase InsO family protein
VSHSNARLTVHGRLVLVKRVESGWSVIEAARAAGVSRQTAAKWVARYRDHGHGGLLDASSRPHRIQPGVPARRCRRIIKARLLHKRGPHWLSWRLHVARSTIYAVLRRFGLSRLKARRTEPVVRYEWAHPGDLVHLDIKKLGRIGEGGGKRVLGPGPGRHFKRLGWDYVHVAIDDHSRLAYAEILSDETGASVAAFTAHALEFFQLAGIDVRRILTDNGAGYCSHAFRDLLLERGIAMRKTRPYRPQTNGKAEAFVKILSNEWAYAHAYRNTKERAEMLGPFLNYYNLSRPHGGIDGQPPISRVA